MAKSIRQSINIQNTIATPKGTTVARPVDTFVQPEKPRELQTAEALKALGQGLGGLAQNYRQQKEQNDLAGIDGEIAAAEASVAAGEIDHIRDHGGFAQYSAAVQLQLNSRLGQKAGTEASSALQDYFSENPADLKDDALRDAAILEFTPELTEGSSSVYNGTLSATYAKAAAALTNTGRQLRSEEVKAELAEGLKVDLQNQIANPDFDVETWDKSDMVKQSGLGHVAIKNLVVDAYIAEAKGTQDPTVLERLPKSMTNILTQNEIREVDGAIRNSAEASRFSKKRQKELDQKIANEAAMQEMQEIHREDPAGFDSANYVTEPTAVYDRARLLERTEMIPIGSSRRSAADAKLLAQKRLGAGDNLEDITNQIQASETMRLEDKDNLVTHIERLEDVPNQLATNKNYGSAIASIKAAGKSTMLSLSDEGRLLLDREVQAQLDQFEDDLYTQYSEYMDENNGKQPPRSVQKSWIRELRKEAVEELEQYIVPDIEPAAEPVDVQTELNSMMSTLFFGE